RSSREPVSRAALAYLPERFTPPHYLTGAEFLRTLAELAGVAHDPARVARLVDELELERDALERPVRSLSKGMTQKLGLAGCLSLEREMYVLDEPMSGLDPAARVAVKSVLQRDAPPPLALVDLGLPPAPHSPDEGFQLIADLLAHSPRMKIFVLSGQNDAANARHARALGAWEFIAKPSDPKLLRRLLARAL